jgi:hypothetical protein
MTEALVPEFKVLEGFGQRCRPCTRLDADAVGFVAFLDRWWWLAGLSNFAAVQIISWCHGVDTRGDGCMCGGTLMFSSGRCHRWLKNRVGSEP